MLATGGSLEHACRLLRQRGAGPMTGVCVLAAPEGIRRLADSGLVEHVVTAAVDERLDERAFIVPGLGDAGDRLFGTA
jgi:uracil phosphoribosyltransferase